MMRPRLVRNVEVGGEDSGRRMLNKRRGDTCACSNFERLFFLVVCILAVSGLFAQRHRSAMDLQESFISFKQSPLRVDGNAESSSLIIPEKNIKRESKRDTAVCYSGSPRDALLKPISKIVLLLWPEYIKEMFKRMPQRLQINFLRWLLKPGTDRYIPDSHREFIFPSLGKFDIFMVIPTNDVHMAKTVCSAYAPQEKTNRIYCAAVPDRPITAEDMGVSKEEFSELKQRWDGGGVFERNLLLQLYGQHLCNRMIKEVETKEKVTYKYMLRQRPDALVMAPLPKPMYLPKKPCAVFCRSVDTYCCGNEDIFLYGKMGIMRRFMDRLFDFGKIDLLQGVKGGELKCASVRIKRNFTSECLNPYWMKKTCGGDVYYVDGIWQHIYRFQKINKVTALEQFGRKHLPNLKMMTLSN